MSASMAAGIAAAASHVVRADRSVPGLGLMSLPSSDRQCCQEALQCSAAQQLVAQIGEAAYFCKLRLFVPC